MAGATSSYYVPEQSQWPIVGSLGLITTVVGVVRMIHGSSFGLAVFCAGLLIIGYMFHGWFSHVIEESMAGKYSAQMDRSFRLGMSWFIFSEVMFFLAFFGALFYATEFSVPWLGGLGEKGISGQVLWPEFQAAWPLFTNPDPSIAGPKEIIHAWGLPAINTLILLTSGGTITWAHWALKQNNRTQLNLGLGVTVLLGVCFLILQVTEYAEAYHHMGLTLHSGIYGTTFFMLTGFHGAHVTIGTIMLIAILGRCLKGHFTPEKHFGFEAVAWYWHFVDFVWIGLFVIVYWRPTGFFHVG